MKSKSTNKNRVAPMEVESKTIANQLESGLHEIEKVLHSTQTNVEEVDISKGLYLLYDNICTLLHVICVLSLLSLFSLLVMLIVFGYIFK